MCLRLSDRSQSLPGDQSLGLIPCVVPVFGLTSGFLKVLGSLESGIEAGGDVPLSLEVSGALALSVPPYGRVT